MDIFRKKSRDDGCDFCRGERPLIATRNLYIQGRKIKLDNGEVIILRYCPRCGKEL